MKIVESQSNLPTNYLPQWLTAVLILAILLIIYITLYPFDFIIAGTQSILDIIASLDLVIFKEKTISDIPRNIVLFIPFGFGFGGLVAYKVRRGFFVLLLTFFAGTIFSLIVEILQTFSLSRNPTLADVLANGFGAGVGFVLYWGLGSRFANWVVWLTQKIRPFVTIQHLTLLFLLYLFLFVSISVQVQKSARFSNWNTNYPLMLGSEVDGTRRWSGSMTSMFILERALTEDEVANLLGGTSVRQIAPQHLVAFYDFLGNGAGNFPALEWQGTPAFAEESTGIFLSPRQWLKSEGSAQPISQALIESAQFTLGTRIAAGRFDKGGPRRIVSISQGIEMRNLTLGQEYRDLVLRLRMPFSNENGRKPELVIPDVFVDDFYHDIIVTYNGLLLTIYIDDPAQKYQIELAPAYTFFNVLPTLNLDKLRLTKTNLFIFSILYDAFVFVPLAALLLFIYGRLSWAIWRKSVFIIGLLLASALLWEVLLSLVLRGYTITLENVLLNFVLVSIAYIFFVIWQRAWSPTAKTT